MPAITARTLKEARPASSAYFIRDSSFTGFAIRVFPSGTIKYVAEVWAHERSHRKTLGAHPVICLKDAKRMALAYIQQVQLGTDHEERKQQTTLEQLFFNYLNGRNLKPSTVKNHTEVIHCYLRDWLRSPVRRITKERVERRFIQIRDKGINGGKPTYSQATKVR